MAYDDTIQTKEDMLAEWFSDLMEWQHQLRLDVSATEADWDELNREWVDFDRAAKGES